MDQFLSEPTLRFFMFLLLGQVDNYYAEQEEGAKFDLSWEGPFDLDRILFDWKDYDTFRNELQNLGLLGHIKEIYWTDGINLAPLQPGHVYRNGILPPVIVTNKKLFKKCWDKYINLFKKNMLASRLQQYLPYEKHDIVMLQILSPLFKKFGNKFKIQYNPKHKDLRFCEYIWLLQEERFLNIESFEEQFPNKIETGPIPPVFNVQIEEKEIENINNFFPQKKSPKRNKKSPNWSGGEWGGMKYNYNETKAMYQGTVITFQDRKKKSQGYWLLRYLIEGQGTCSRKQLEEILGKNLQNIKNPRQKILSAWNSVCVKFGKDISDQPPFKLYYDRKTFTATLKPKE